LYVKYHNYQAAFYTAAALAAVALICEMLAKRPTVPAGTSATADTRAPEPVQQFAAVASKESK